MKVLHTFILGGFCTATFSAACFAASLTGTVSASSNGTGLSGAAISLMKKSGRDTAEVGYQTISGERGAFTFSEIDGGNYSLVVTYPGHLPKGVPTLVIEDGKSNVIDVALDTAKMH